MTRVWIAGYRIRLTEGVLERRLQQQEDAEDREARRELDPLWVDEGGEG